MENIKEEKAREYAEVQYGDPRKYEYRSELDKFEECLEHFKAGFEAGKQERDRESELPYQKGIIYGRELERKEIIKKLKERLKNREKEGGYSESYLTAYDTIINDLENLSK